MPAATRSAKWERPGGRRLRTIFKNLACELTWIDLLAGLLGTLVLSGLLVGFHYHSIPEYSVGDIAAQDYRAPADLDYEDETATAAERQVARDQTAALYDFESALTARRVHELQEAFSAARTFLAEKGIARASALSPEVQSRLNAELQPLVGMTIPAGAMPVLLRQMFSETLERRVIRVLEAMMRGCVVADPSWPQFLKDQRLGIVIRDRSTGAERPLAGSYLARSRTAASEYLRQFQLEFADLSPQNRVRMLDFVDRMLEANLAYNPAETELRREAAAARVVPAAHRIKQGKTLVRGGEEVTPAIAAQLRSLRNLMQPRSLPGQLAGFALFIAAFLYGLWHYLVCHRGRPGNPRRQSLLILCVLLETFLVIRLLTGLADLLADRVAVEALRGPYQLYYVLPFALGGMLAALLADVHLGIITSMMVASLAGLFFGDVYIAAYALLGSLGGIFTLHLRYQDRAAILKAGIVVGMIDVLAVLGIDFLRQAPLEASGLSLRMLYGFMGGVLASPLASLLLPTLESLFAITTDIRLLELSNLNTPALRRLAVDAPGTYHHSLMVGTLGEAAAEAIGANPLLVRVGAYYHDLGKMVKPEYFVENQVFGMNKHETLSPNMSCLIIASHVKDGMDIAREMRLAQGIRDLIPQHHGTRIMTYFYRKALDAMNGKSHEINEADFRYPGPRPQTKEAAVLMMADSVEAASRSLTDPSPAQIRGMIDRLTDAILEDNQFDECDITLREIGLIKESIFKILTGLYHRRLDYPGYDFKNTQDKADRFPAANSSARHAKAV